jgi:hypothetical protein
MFNPEFRYLLVQEENNNVMMPFINNDIIITIFIFICAGINVLAISTIFWMSYKLFGYSSLITKFIWTALWHSLTPGNQWLEIALLVSSIIAAYFMIIAFKGIEEIIDSGFTKLKNEINKKDEKIKELEAKLLSLEESSKTSKCNVTSKDIQQFARSRLVGCIV